MHMKPESVYTEDHFIELLEALHCDRGGLLDSVHKIESIMDSFSWLEDGSRGSYAWDDDEYYKEIGRCFAEIRGVIGKTMKQNSEAHQICCNRYRHVRFGDRTGVQMKFHYGFPNIAEQVEDVMKYATIEGDRGNGLSYHEN